jgi:hypothetical protein
MMDGLLTAIHEKELANLRNQLAQEKARGDEATGLLMRETETLRNQLANVRDELATERLRHKSAEASLLRELVVAKDAKEASRKDAETAYKAMESATNDVTRLRALLKKMVACDVCGSCCDKDCRARIRSATRSNWGAGGVSSGRTTT